jgi:hypothetical protein
VAALTDCQTAGVFVDKLYDSRRENLRYKYSYIHLKKLACELSGLIVTSCSEQLPRIEVRHVYLLWRVAWLLRQVVRLLKCISDQLNDCRHQKPGIKCSEVHLQTLY